MKKFGLFICLFAFLFACVGCSFVEDIIGEDDDDDGNEYVWEYGLIPSYCEESTSGYTFEQVKSFRNRLITNSNDYEPATTTNEAEIRELLQQGRASTTEIETVISLFEIG